MFNIKLSKVLLIGAFFFLYACSVASTIQRADASKSEFDDAVYEGEEHIVNGDIDGAIKYRIYHQASTGFTSIQSIRISSTKRADDFCSKKGNVMQVISERTSSPPHIFGNFPRIEIIFVCLGRADIEPNPDERTNQYENLRNLKSLFDDGAITQDEYDIEKKEILSK